MWVEFTGLPGVGKSTLFQKNKETISKKYKIITSHHCGLMNTVRTRLNYMRYYCEIADKNLIKHLCYRLSFRPLVFKKKNILFYDAGLIQPVLENLIETNFKDTPQKISFLRKIMPANQVIYITENTETIIKRELNRTPRRYNLDEAELGVRYEKACKTLENELLPLTNKIDKIQFANNKELLKALSL